MTCKKHQFSTREAFTSSINIGSHSFVLHEESDLEDTSSTSCSNALLTVRKRNCHFNHIADSATKVDVDGTDDRAHVFKSAIIGSRLENVRSEEHTSELQSPDHLVCRLLLEKKKKTSRVCIQDYKV